MAADNLLRVEREIKKVIVGKSLIIRRVLTAVLAGGHILLEDVPGVGKTTLAVAFSKAMNLQYKRTQFTPDILPSDVVGFCMFDKDERKKVYVPGSILCNLYLADEINRTSSKTQAALLEAPGSVHRHGNGEPGRRGRNADASGFPAGPLHGTSEHGLSRSRGRSTDDEGKRCCEPD